MHLFFEYQLLFPSTLKIEENTVLVNSEVEVVLCHCDLGLLKTVIWWFILCLNI